MSGHRNYALSSIYFGNYSENIMNVVVFLSVVIAIRYFFKVSMEKNSPFVIENMLSAHFGG